MFSENDLSPFKPDFNIQSDEAFNQLRKLSLTQWKPSFKNFGEVSLGFLNDFGKIIKLFSSLEGFFSNFFHLEKLLVTQSFRKSSMR